MQESETPRPRQLRRLQEFLGDLPFDAESFSIGEISVTDLKTLAEIERGFSDSEIFRQDANATRDVLRQDAEARFKLLSLVAWMAAVVVGVNLLLLGLVVGAAVYRQYQADPWFLRILATGPAVAIVGMLGAMVTHYWPRKTDWPRKPPTGISKPRK